MNIQPYLENNLTILRPLRREDFNDLYEVAKDPLIWDQHQCSDRFKMTVYSDYFKESLISKGALIAIDKVTGEIIGSSRYNQIEDAIEIGWSFLSRKYWGGKYNKSIKKMMIEYAFNDVDTIVFYINKLNIRSQKAIEKLGGRRITNTQLDNLIRKTISDYTYFICKNNWKR